MHKTPILTLLMIYHYQHQKTEQKANRAHFAPTGKDDGLSNKNYPEIGNNAVQAAPPNFPPVRVVERKIGRATFIVSSRFSDGREKDIVSTLSRIIGYESDKPDK